MTKRKAIPPSKEEEIKLNEDVINVEDEVTEEEIKNESERLKSKFKSDPVEKNKSFGSVPDKLVKNLNDDERTLILKNYTDGVENENFNVNILKNGGVNITRKRTGKVKSLNDEIIKQVTSIPGKVGQLSTEQFMLSHFMNLEREFDKLKTKQKRLKKKYKRIKSDIYVNDDDDEIVIDKSVDEKEKVGVDDHEKVKEKVEEKVVAEPVNDNNKPTYQQPVYQNNVINRKLTLRETLLLRQQQQRC